MMFWRKIPQFLQKGVIPHNFKYSMSVWTKTVPGQNSVNISICSEAKHPQNKKLIAEVKLHNWFSQWKKVSSLFFTLTHKQPGEAVQVRWQSLLTIQHCSEEPELKLIVKSCWRMSWAKMRLSGGKWQLTHVGKYNTSYRYTVISTAQERDLGVTLNNYKRSPQCQLLSEIPRGAFRNCQERKWEKNKMKKKIHLAA